MPNDKDTLEAIKEALSKTPWNLTQHGKEMRTAPEWLRYLLLQNEQQQAEIEEIRKFFKDEQQDLADLHKQYQEECAKLQQSREEVERLKQQLLMFDNRGEALEIMHVENERLRGELEQANAELSGVVLAYETRGKKLNDVFGERDDYRKVLEWYAGGNEDDGLKAESILSRYPIERGDSQNERD